LPFPSLRAGRPEYPFTDWHDQAAVLSNSYELTAVRLKVEENQLVGVFGEIGVRVDGLKSA
jgi:hypothetical protein